MADPSAPLPNVLIVGGLTSVSRQFADSLLPANGPPLCASLRIIDKYMVDPPTTYVGPTFPQFVKRPGVEYKQNNLTLPERLSSVFDPPDNGRPWEYVFDFLGETTYEASERTQILQTYKASVNCAEEAARRGKVKAYVRLTHGFYICEPEGRLHTEDEPLQPDGVRGIWWHETLRALAAIPNLPLVVLRAAIPYGPYCSSGVITRRILIGEVYRYKDRKMEYLWSPNLRLNTVHTDDIAAACWAAAGWIATVGRQQALAQAGVPLAFSNEPEKLNGLPGVVPPDQSPRAPFFNLVDASDTTQQVAGEAIASCYGIDFGFHEVPNQTESDLEALAGDINLWHGEVWYTLCQLNQPPIEYPPMSTYVEAHDLTDLAVAYDGTKFQRITGYRLKRPQFTTEAIAEIVRLFKDEGVFPNVPGTDPDPDDEDEDDDYDNDEGVNGRE